MMRYAFFPQMPQNRTYSFRFFSRFKVDHGIFPRNAQFFPLSESDEKMGNLKIFEH